MANRCNLHLVFWRRDRGIMMKALVAALSALLLLSACATSNAPGGAGRRTPFPAATGHTFRDASFAPELVVLPAGTFLMGSAEADALRDGRRAETAAWERPAHQVMVAPMAVSRYLVTRTEYAAFVTATKRSNSDGCMVLDGKWQLEAQRSFLDPAFPQSAIDPAVCVVVADAEAYVQWLSAQTAQQYRLLREAEWEYAARAGSTGSRWWQGDVSTLCAHANGADQSYDRAHPGDSKVNTRCDDGYAHTNPGNAFPPNAFGLHDMLGNVWEWIDDCFVGDYRNAPPDAATQIRGGDCGQRIIRGGSWHNYPDALRTPTRFSLPVTMRSASVGFRVVRLPQ
jgi:formylglycine-generating enzyme required for sulfatase activity